MLDAPSSPQDPEGPARYPQDPPPYVEWQCDINYQPTAELDDFLDFVTNLDASAHGFEPPADGANVFAMSTSRSWNTQAEADLMVFISHYGKLTTDEVCDWEAVRAAMVGIDWDFSVDELKTCWETKLLPSIQKTREASERARIPVATTAELVDDMATCANTRFCTCCGRYSYSFATGFEGEQPHTDAGFSDEPTTSELPRTTATQSENDSRPTELPCWANMSDEQWDLVFANIPPEVELSSTGLPLVIHFPDVGLVHTDTLTELSRTELQTELLLQWELMMMRNMLQQP